MNEKTSKKEVSIDEKIDELIEWYKKYPKIKLIGRVKSHSTYYYEDEAKEYGIDEIDLKVYHEKMEKYFEYVITRKKAGKLTEEQINRCKEGNLGLIFGYSDEVKKFSEEYQKKEETALDIIRICGSVENFINSYKTGTLKKQGLLCRDGFIPTLNNRNKIDMDSNPNAKNYFRLIQSIGSSMNFEPYYHECLSSQYNNIIVFSSKEIDEALHILNPREEEIIRARFGLDDGKSKDLGQTGKKLGLSRERIRQIEAKTLRKIKETQRDVFEEIMPVALGQIGDLMEEEGYSQDERLPEGLNFIEYNEMITDDEKRILSEIVDDIWNSKMLFRDNGDEKSPDFDIKRLEVIKEIKANIKKREEQKRVSEEQKLSQEEQKELLKERILETTIEDLNLSTRSFNGLKRAGIHNLQALLHRSKKELLKFKGMGKASVDEIISKLSEYGIVFNQDGELEFENLQEQTELSDDISIEQLDLSARAYNGLARAGIKTVQDIIDADAKYGLERLWKLGEHSIDEIRKKIEGYKETHKDEEKIENSKDEVETIEEDTEVIEEREEEKTELELLREKRDKLLEKQRRIEEKRAQAKELSASYYRFTGNFPKNETPNLDDE